MGIKMWCDDCGVDIRQRPPSPVMIETVPVMELCMDCMYKKLEERVDESKEVKQKRIAELEMKVSSMARKKWGDNAVEFLVGAMSSISSESQLQALTEEIN